MVHVDKRLLGLSLHAWELSVLLMMMNILMVFEEGIVKMKRLMTFRAQLMVMVLMKPLELVSVLSVFMYR